jgi:multidrug efflux pump subunit AcrA (membrane-fusion protein)
MISVGLSLAPSFAQAAIEKKPIVFVRAVQLKELAETLDYPARVEPRVKASVTAEVDGVVTKIIAPLGSVVKNRAPLLVIRNTDPVYQYAPMVVASTVSGVVSRVEVTEGSRVVRGDKLVLVTDPDHVRIVVEVTAQDALAIKPGLEAQLKSVGTDSQEPIKLKVEGISPFVDPATGTASCELDVEKVAAAKVARGADKKSEKIKTPTIVARLPQLGMIGRVSFRVNIRKGISISDSAITFRGHDPFVRIVVDGKAKLVAVTLGRKESGSVEILKGLKPGDQVVERASGFVADGEAVDVQVADKDSATKG